MDGVGTPIIGRPRPLPGHDTPNPAYHPHTLNYEEPLYLLCRTVTACRLGQWGDVVVAVKICPATSYSQKVYIQNYPLQLHLKSSLTVTPKIIPSL